MVLRARNDLCLYRKTGAMNSNMTSYKKSIAESISEIELMHAQTSMLCLKETALDRLPRLLELYFCLTIFCRFVLCSDELLVFGVGCALIFSRSDTCILRIHCNVTRSEP